MKKVPLFVVVLYLAACGDASGDRSAEMTRPDGVAGEIVEVVCDSLQKLSQKSVSETKVAWRCEHQGEGVDLDVYVSQAAKQTASDDALALLGTDSTSQSWVNTPILCGSDWTMGVADLATRDALIAELNAAGVAASTC
ncbi:MAG: hypothetical protein ACKO92_05115 [Actinomycetota bacterium]